MVLLRMQDTNIGFKSDYKIANTHIFYIVDYLKTTISREGFVCC